MAKGTIKKAGTELVVEKYLLTDKLNMNAGTVIEKQLAITKAGYMPIGVVGYNIAPGTSGTGSGMSHLHFYKLYLFDVQPGSCTVETYIRNSNTAKATNIAIYLDVLWQKV